MQTYTEFRNSYHHFTWKKVLFIIICIIASIASLGIGLSVGDYEISFIDSYVTLWKHIVGTIPETYDEMMAYYVVWELRLPRTIGTLCVGAVLAICGVAMQCTMKNPLADPYTTGISSGASFGVALLAIYGFSLIPSLSYNFQVVVNAFIFSLIPTAIILFFSKIRKTSPTRVILTGIAVMYIFSATTSLLMLTADPDNLAEVYNWNLGNLGSLKWDNIPFCVSSSFVCITMLTVLAKKLNILGMEDGAVKSLGIEPNKLRTIILMIVSVCTALIVSFTGTIGFVGLVIPHIVRLVIGSDCKYLIPASAVFGGLFLIICDMIAKSVMVSGLPVGVITSLIGGPLFIYILLKQSKN